MNCSDLAKPYLELVEKVSAARQQSVPCRESYIREAAKDLEIIYADYLETADSEGPLKLSSHEESHVSEVRRLNLHITSALLLAGVSDLGHQLGETWEALPFGQHQLFMRVLNFSDALHDQILALNN